MHSLNKFLPGDTLTIKCFDGYQLMMGKTRYQYQGIVCDKKGSWDAYDGTGVLPTCEGTVLIYESQYTLSLELKWSDCYVDYSLNHS